MGKLKSRYKLAWEGRRADFSGVARVLLGWSVKGSCRLTWDAYVIAKSLKKAKKKILRCYDPKVLEDSPVVWLEPGYDGAAAYFKALKSIEAQGGQARA